MATPKDCVNVPLSPEQRAFVERQAQDQDRTMASFVRRLIAAAMAAEPESAPTKRSRGSAQAAA